MFNHSLTHLLIFFSRSCSLFKEKCYMEIASRGREGVREKREKEGERREGKIVIGIYCYVIFGHQRLLQREILIKFYSHFFHSLQCCALLSKVCVYIWLIYNRQFYGKETHKSFKFHNKYFLSFTSFKTLLISRKALMLCAETLWSSSQASRNKIK